MRTTIRLDDRLLFEVKQLAQQSGQTMTEIVEEALRQLLANRQQLTKQPKVKLIVVSGNGLQSGVDLDDSAALLELMESLDDSA